MMNIVLIFIGGGLGAVARYLLQGVVYRITGAAFPYGTLVVNVLGCLLIGLLMSSMEERFLASPSLRIFLTIGILGGFTTFSSFSYESMALIREGDFLSGGLNIVASVVTCLGATWLGLGLGRYV
ncbi:MAG TPA: fluoride efflux transporter CrcB [Bacteroidota bacterium]|nr:fluoride efflux transporter CrcB [Bacteroidota bacterium]